MRILIVSPYYFPYTSGMTVCAQRIAEGLAKRGHSVRILTHNHNRLPPHEKLNNVEIFRVPAMIKFGRGIFSPWMTKKFIELVEGADVVNIHAPFFECGLLARLAKKRGKKVFLNYHCDLFLKGILAPHLIGSMHKISLKVAAKNSDAILVNSLDYGKESYMKKFFSKMVEVLPPMDDNIFKKVYSDNFRKKYRIAKGDFVVGFLGRLTHEKGLEFLVDSMKLLEGKIKNLKLLIGGEGILVAGGESESIETKLKKRISGLGLSNVIFTGKIPDKNINDFFSSLDIFVLPSINRLESFGMVQVEAMLCGVPVVASKMPGVSEPVKKTGFGILAVPKNPKELAEAIFEIYKNPKKYKPERKKVAEIFGIKKTLDKYEEIFGC